MKAEQKSDREGKRYA